VGELMKRILIALLIFAGITTFAWGQEDDYDEVMEILLARKDYDFNRDKIEYLSKINLGVPGGGEWLAVREDGWIYIYVVDSEKKVRIVGGISVPEQITYWERDRGNRFVLEFDIMQNIPGTQIGNLPAAFGDYNGDGFDEIFFYTQGNYEDCGIRGYNSGTDKMESYFASYFNIKSRLGPPPVEFTNYQGIDGVMVSYSKDNYHTDYIWEFWAWDEGSRKYVKLAETGKEDVDYSQFTPITPKVDNQKDNESEAAVNIAETESVQPEETVVPAQEGKSTKFGFLFGIIVGIAVLMAVVGFIVMRRKK
jgi:hypothetical protein